MRGRRTGLRRGLPAQTDSGQWNADESDAYIHLKRRPTGAFRQLRNRPRGLRPGASGLRPIAALLLPLPALAQGYVEAVKTTQLSGLENTYPAWSPDGSKIVFESTRNDVADSTPVFTPDGRFIVWASELDGNLDLFRMAADRSRPVNLTRHPGTDGHPRVSPDGRRICFNSNRASDPATFARGYMDREYNHEIYSMALDGGDVRRVTDLPDWDT